MAAVTQIKPLAEKATLRAAIALASDYLEVDTWLMVEIRSVNNDLKLKLNFFNLKSLLRNRINLKKLEVRVKFLQLETGIKRLEPQYWVKSVDGVCLRWQSLGFLYYSHNCYKPLVE